MKVWKVSELNKIARDILESEFYDIYVEGEVSNFKIHTSGHIYFSLKDENAQINAVMYRYKAMYLSYIPKNGDKVIVRGTVSIFTKRGDYQIITHEIKPVGIGELKLKFEELKKKLEKEGLFDPSRKRNLPQLPKNVAVITSPTGAAIRDIINVLKNRFENINLLIYPVKVQGDDAKYEIAEAFNNLNEKFKDIDVIILARGGGSMEDLWPFNEEIVARAIFSSKIPVISAVGHEIDWTIADYVADLRAPTPSAAAMVLVESKKNLKRFIYELGKRLINAERRIFFEKKLSLKNLIKRKILRTPHKIYEDILEEIDYLTEKLIDLSKRVIKEGEKNFLILSEKLKILSPFSVLERGYSIAFKLPEKKILTSSKEVKKEDRILLKLKKGEINCEVV
ncbi:MAG: exodeoxyribonuclease VII large subunit [Caldiserica bacterium]|nr:MAG: exodeoxyribonuclease VII large subunit [Caldisericota bacterium]